MKKWLRKRRIARLEKQLGQHKIDIWEGRDGSFMLLPGHSKVLEHDGLSAHKHHQRSGAPILGV